MITVPVVEVNPLVAINMSIVPEAVPGGYNCTPPIPNGEITDAGDLLIGTGLDESDSGEHICTSENINGFFHIDLNVIGKYMSHEKN